MKPVEMGKGNCTNHTSSKIFNWKILKTLENWLRKQRLL